MHEWFIISWKSCASLHEEYTWYIGGNESFTANLSLHVFYIYFIYRETESQLSTSFLPLSSFGVRPGSGLTRFVSYPTSSKARKLYNTSIVLRFSVFQCSEHPSLVAQVLILLHFSRFNYGRPGSSVRTDPFGGRASASRKKGGRLLPIERTKTPGAVSF